LERSSSIPCSPFAASANRIGKSSSHVEIVIRSQVSLQAQQCQVVLVVLSDCQVVLDIIICYSILGICQNGATQRPGKSASAFRAVSVPAFNSCEKNKEWGRRLWHPAFVSHALASQTSNAAFTFRRSTRCIERHTSLVSRLSDSSRRSQMCSPRSPSDPQRTIQFLKTPLLAYHSSCAMSLHRRTRSQRSAVHQNRAPMAERFPASAVQTDKRLAR